MSFLEVNIPPVHTSPDLLKLETTDVHLGDSSSANISLICSYLISYSIGSCAAFPCRFVLSFPNLYIPNELITAFSLAVSGFYFYLAILKGCLFPAIFFR